ncbi:MAG: hypothetical protein RSE41_03075 [Clostridia bacterium]
MITHKDKINLIKYKIQNLDEKNNIGEIENLKKTVSLYENNDNTIKLENDEVLISENDISLDAIKDINAVNESIKDVETKVEFNRDETIKKISLNSYYNNIEGPWDKRLYRITNNYEEIPYSKNFTYSSTSDYYISKESFDSLDDNSKAKIGKSWDETIGKKLETMSQDDLYKGTKSIINPYAIVSLYGSKGGSLLMNKKDQRSWYEVDTAQNFAAGFSKIPTTQALISWGNGDPYGRTPYQYSDFVFSKYWNKIQNNRLITLRRFPAPILDNMNFPGMNGLNSSDIGSNTSGGKPLFAPMSTAITYFGDETNNKLSDILKFKSGIPWDKAKGEVFDVNIQGGAPNGTDNLQDLYGLGSILRHLNIASGDWNFDSAINGGAPPPDPWANGPWQNRVMGPINRVDEVSMRKAGIVFEMNNLNITFEYNARPIGGINTKAIMLDILSNFLTMGSLNAVFFGGQHRFMSAPAATPFPGKDKGIQSWYSGDATGFMDATMSSFANAGSIVLAGFKDILNKFLNVGKNFKFSDLSSSIENIKNLPGDITQTGSDSGDMIGNIQKGLMSAHTRKGIPYLIGMRALLTGEPVGEWHLTIGNPLNPIAMLGNLICKDIEVEFGDELGPDDFPITLKVVVKLENAMARDKDAIQSVFNRGMGRIYALPDNMQGSADFQTKVDTATQDHNISGNDATFYYGDTPVTSGNEVVGAQGESSESSLVNTGSPSVWNRSSYVLQVKQNDYTIPNINNRTAFRSLKWIGMAALK